MTSFRFRFNQFKLFSYVVTILELTCILMTITYVLKVSQQYEYSRRHLEDRFMYWLLSSLSLNAFLLVLMVILTAYFKRLYQSSAIQMRKNFGVSSSNGLSSLFFNIVGRLFDLS